MVNDRAFIFYMYNPWDKTLSLVSKSRSHVKVTCQGQGELSKSQLSKKWPLREHSCFTNISCSLVFNMHCFSKLGAHFMPNNCSP